MIGVAAGVMAALLTHSASGLVPGPEDVHVQKIRKAKGEKDWPFVAEEGHLICVNTFAQPMVTFLPSDGPLPRTEIVLDVNPFSVVIQSIGRKDALLPAKSPEEMIKRIAPFVAMGKMLCKQKSDPVVPGSEL